MKVAFIGDLHGDVGSTRRIIKQLPDDLDLVLQVGDFGYWPERNDWHAFVRAVEEIEFKSRLGFYWIDGNHEDHRYFHDVLPHEIGLSYLPRNSITTFEDVSVLALGGAISVDRYHRTEGRNWFATEAPSLVELSDAHLAARKLLSLPTYPIVISHEAPAVRVPFCGLPFQLPPELLFASALHRFALEEIYRGMDEIAPMFTWVHGHWHEHGVYRPYEGAHTDVVALDESRAAFEKVVHIIEVTGAMVEGEVVRGNA